MLSGYSSVRVLRWKCSFDISLATLMGGKNGLRILVLIVVGRCLALLYQK